MYVGQCIHRHNRSPVPQIDNSASACFHQPLTCAQRPDRRPPNPILSWNPRSPRHRPPSTVHCPLSILHRLPSPLSRFSCLLAPFAIQCLPSFLLRQPVVSPLTNTPACGILFLEHLNNTTSLAIIARGTRGSTPIHRPSSIVPSRRSMAASRSSAIGRRPPTDRLDARGMLAPLKKGSLAWLSAQDLIHFGC